MRVLPFCFLIFVLIAAQCNAAFSPAVTFPKTGKVACVDYDKDGFTDLIIGLRVYHNRGNGTFQQVSVLPPTVDPNGAGTSIAGPTAWVDFDGDGFRDVLILGDCAGSKLDSDNNAIGHAPDRIFMVTGYSNGVPTLGSSVDITGWDVPYLQQNSVETVMTNPNATFGIAVADFNRDGRPDIYLGRGRIGDIRTGSYPEWYGKDWLVKNVSSGGAIAMTDVSNSVGLTRVNQHCPAIFAQWQFRSTDSVGVCDYNYDGFPDFFSSSYRCKCNAFWIGGPGDKHNYTITNAAHQHHQQFATGLDLTNLEHPDALHGCGVHWLDYDNDGYFDLLEGRFSHFIAVGALRLWRNNGDGTFTNASSLLPQIQFSYSAQHYKSIAVGDYDNDGDLDVYLTRRGSSIVPSRNDLPASSQGRLLRNDLVETGSPGFTDVTAQENLDNVSHADGLSACFIDFNNDGKLDLFTAPGYSAPDNIDELWRNDGNHAGNWLVMDLSPPREAGGIRINPDAIGAVVQIWIDRNMDGAMAPGEVLTRQQMGSTTGNLWQGPVPLHFGLGSCAPDQLPMKGRVLWPGAVNADGQPMWMDFDIPGVNQRITVDAAPPPSGAPGIPYAPGPYSLRDVTFSWEQAEDLGQGVLGYRCQIGTVPGAGDVFDGEVGAATSMTFAGVDQTTYYCRVRAIDGECNHGIWSPSSDGVTVDLAGPVGSVVINNGADFTSNTSVSLRLSATDAGSGISEMKLSIDGGASWEDWERFSESRVVQILPGEGVKRVCVAFRDVLGNESIIFEDTVILDQTPPSLGTLVAPATADSVPIPVTYTGVTDQLSGVRSVSLWFKQGEGGTWLPATCASNQGASEGSFLFADLTGQGVYHFALVAEDNTGNRSTLPVGDGASVTCFVGPAPLTISAAKMAPPGVIVDTNGIVSAVFDDCFYIQSVDRSVGIRVSSDADKPEVTTRVRVTGQTSELASGEICVAADSVTELDGRWPVSPVCMNNRTVGGGQRGSQKGVHDGAGLNNIGLLVRVCGRTSSISDGVFTLEDQTEASITVIVGPGVTVPDAGSHAAVTGVVSCIKDSQGRIQRAILATGVAAY